MKYYFFGSLLGALCLAVAAQVQPSVGEITVSGTQPPIQLPDKPFRMRESDFRDFKGSYLLNNGKTLYVNGFAGKKYAKLEGQDYAELVAAGPSSFVALDQQMDMVFFPEIGEITDVRLRVVVPRDQASLDEPERVVTLFARR